MSTFAHRYPEHISAKMMPRLLDLLTKREPILQKIIEKTELREIDDANAACASISIADNKLAITINHHKFKRLFSEEKIAVLAHEYGHGVLGHLSSRTFPTEDRFVVCLAQDLALNEGLLPSYKLPAWFVTARSLGLPAKMSASQYIAELQKINQKKLRRTIIIPDMEVRSNPATNRKIVKAIIDQITII